MSEHSFHYSFKVSFYSPRVDVNSQLRNFALGRVAAEQARPQQAQVRPDAENRGATIIVDNFLNSTSHGFQVEGAARSLGQTGTVIQVNQHQVENGRLTMPHAKALKSLQTEFASGPLSAELAGQHLDSFVTQAAAGNVKLAASHLAGIEAEGFQNSVVNLSQGVDALNLMDMAKMALSPKSKLSAAQQQQYSSNLQSALLEPSEHGGATEKLLDQRLLQRVSTLLKESPEVQSAVKQWREGVERFESAHNSVVVASGNSGKAFQALARDGFTLDGSEDHNLLAVPEVTTVGATSRTADGDLSLSHTSFGPEVDVLAPGDHAGLFGTSYASPKVASALRAVHVLRPDFTSNQAESWLKENLAASVEVLNQPVALLNTDRAAALLQALEKRQ